MNLRLPKLADRTPVKLALTIDPLLYARLADYARLYQATYGEAARIEDLAPVMLARFLEGDRYFRKARKDILKPAAGD